MCRNRKNDLPLWRLGEFERQAIRQHAATCPSCQRLLDYVQVERAKLKKVMSVEVTTDRSKLTERIMAAIEKKEGRSLLDFIPPFFWSPPAKYALAMISLFLVAFFISEYNQSTVDSKPFYPNKLISTQRPTILNAKSDQNIPVKKGKQNYTAAQLFHFLRDRHDSEVSYFSKINYTKLKRK